MKKPIPHNGTHKTPKGEVLIFCGKAKKLREFHNKLHYIVLMEDGETSPFIFPPDGVDGKESLYLREEDYKKLNVRDNGIPWDIEEPEIPEGYRFEVRGYGWNNGGKKSEYGFYMSDRGIWGYTDEASYNLGIDCQFFIELIKEEEHHKKCQRDMSGMEDFLKLVTPRVRERIIELSNNTESKTYPTPASLGQCFVWGYTIEGSEYWRDLHNKKEGHHALLATHRVRYDKFNKYVDTDTELETLRQENLDLICRVDECNLEDDLEEPKKVKSKRICKQFNEWFGGVRGVKLGEDDGDKYLIFVQLAKNIKI